MRQNISYCYAELKITLFCNCTPNSVVESTNVNSFKARLGKLCLHQKVKFDFNAGLIETEDRPRQTESGMV